MTKATGKSAISTPATGPFKTCSCGHVHDDNPSAVLSEEDMKSFVLNNWSPALQAAFGDHWREHFQSKPQHARSDDDSGASSSHVFEGFLPMSPAILEDAPGEEQHYGSPGCSDKELPSEAERDFYLGRGGKIRNFETRSMEEELQHLEMTAGFSEGLRSHALPRRCVKIKRPGKSSKTLAGNGLRTGVRLHISDSRAASQNFAAEAPRGQKRPANFLTSDVPRQCEADFLESPEGTPSSTPSLSTDGLDAGLDFLTNPIAGSPLGSPTASEGPGRLEGDVESLSGKKGGWGGSPLHMAAATGRADVVQQLLLAGVSPLAWSPISTQALNSQSGVGGSQGYGPQSLSQSWQSRWDPAGAGSLKAPDLIPCLPPLPVDPLSGSTAASGSSKRRCTSRDAMPYGYVEALVFDFCTAVHIAAYYGHWQVIRQFLDSSQCDPCQLFASRNSQGATALHMAAHRGHTSVVQALGKLKSVEINAVDNNGRTALHHAAATGHHNVVSELWALGCALELTDCVGWTALHHAAERGHTEIVGQLVIAGANVQRVDLRGFTSAHLAASQGHIDVLEKLLMAGYDVDTLANMSVLGGVYNTGSSCLHLAAQHGHLPMVERLLAAGANPKVTDYRGCDPLQCAAEGGHAGIFELLLKHDCNPMGADHLNATLLHYAASGGNLEIMQKLLDLGCDEDALTKYGRSVLHYSAYGGKVEAFEMLVKLGCDMNRTDNDGNTVWLAAAQSQNVNLLKKLLEHGCDLHAVNDSKCTALHYACRAGSEGNLEMAKLLVEEGLDVQAACIDGKTAIHYATQFGQEEIVYFLLQRDAEQLVNKPDGSGWTPLHYAAEQGCLSLVESFLQGGALVDAMTCEGWTALHLASKDRHLHIVNKLLEAGGDASVQDSHGCTALHFAARMADMPLFQTLYKHPSSLSNMASATGPGGYTLLHYAVEGGNRDIVKLLLDDGMGVPLQKQQPGHERSFTPLHLAARAGFAELVPMLLEDGYQVHTLDQEGRTPLHCASLGSSLGWYEGGQPGLLRSPPRSILENSAMAKELLGQGADPKSLDAGLYSALHYASGLAWTPMMSRNMAGHSSIAAELLEGGVDPKALDDKMCCALHYASGSGDASVVARLIELGCSPTAIDGMGWSPLMWAASGGHVAIIIALAAHGADFMITDDRGRSPLHWAAERGHVEAVDLLVEKFSEQNLDLHGPVSFSQEHRTGSLQYEDIMERIVFIQTRLVFPYVSAIPSLLIPLQRKYSGMSAKKYVSDFASNALSTEVL